MASSVQDPGPYCLDHTAQTLSHAQAAVPVAEARWRSRGGLVRAALSMLPFGCGSRAAWLVCAVVLCGCGG